MFCPCHRQSIQRFHMSLWRGEHDMMSDMTYVYAYACGHTCVHVHVMCMHAQVHAHVTCACDMCMSHMHTCT